MNVNNKYKASVFSLLFSDPLYNGRSQCPDESVMRLSDMFENPASLGIPVSETIALELKVRILNINEGKNKHIADKCRILAHYSAFIAKVREYENEGYRLKESLKKAMIFCQNHDILKEFLERNASEVLNLLMTEWNWDDALAVRYEEGREEGMEEGMEKGRKEGREEIARNAIAEGATIDFVNKITGLDIEAIRMLLPESILR